ILAAAGTIPAAAIDGVAFLGELGLDGRLRPVRGVLPAMAAAAGARFCQGGGAQGERGDGAVVARARGARGAAPVALALWVRRARGRVAGVAARRTGGGSRGYGLGDGGAGAAARGAARDGWRRPGAAVSHPWPAGASPTRPVRRTRPARRAPGRGDLRRWRPS